VLYGLEFDHYIQPQLNMEAWAEYHEQRAIAAEIDEERLVVRPRCPLLFEWLGETPKLSIDLIRKHVYPRIDPVSGRVVVTDWREMVAMKADVDVAVGELQQGGPCFTCTVDEDEPTYHGAAVRRAAELAVQDHDLEAIAHRMRAEIPETITALRAVDKHVRARTRLDDRGGALAPPHCTAPHCTAAATHAWVYEPRCFAHWPGAERPRV